MKRNVLVDIKVIAEAPASVTRWAKDQEQAAKWLEDWCQELKEFFRDHRSRDGIGFRVERVFEEQCSHCGYRWETFDDGEPECCDAAKKEWAEAKKVSS